MSMAQPEAPSGSTTTSPVASAVTAAAVDAARLGAERADQAAAHRRDQEVERAGVVLGGAGEAVVLALPPGVPKVTTSPVQAGTAGPAGSP